MMSPTTGSTRSDRAAASIIDPLSEQSWDDLVHRSPLGSIFSSASWLSVLADAYGMSPRAAVVRGDDGRLRAAIPFCRLDDPLGVRLRSLPFSDYCDPLGADFLFPAAVEPLLASGLPLILRVLHHRTSRDRSDSFRLVGEAAWHGVDLEPGVEEVMAGLRGTAARNAALAQRLGVQVRIGSRVEDVAAFYRLHCQLRRTKYRMLAQPWSFFEKLHHHFAAGERLQILLAEHDGRVVAGILALRWGRTLYYKFNASIDTSTRPNDLLVVRALELGCELGCDRLDLGLSDLDQPGLLRFKRKFATQEARISTLAAGPGAGGAAPHAADVRALIGQLTELLTEPGVPEHVTARGGDVLYRYFA